MSYESKLDHQSDKLINPTQLCLLLSVALHLLLLKFGLPTLEFNNDDGKREVSIIELNAEQQSRLPDLEPQLETSDLAELAKNIPPNLLPGNTDPANLPPLIIPPPPQFNFLPSPPTTDITLPPVGNWSSLPLPPQIDPSDFKVEPIKLPPNLGKVPQQSTKPAALKTPPNPSTITKPKNPPQKQPEVKPETQPKTKPQETPEIIATRKVTQSQQRVTSLHQSLTKTKDGNSNEQANRNYIDWVNKVNEVPSGEIKIKGTYPRDACILRLKGSSVFGVVVNAKGQVVALDLLKGAEYPIFNQQGNQDLKGRIFDNDTNKPKPYQVEVNYEYDAEICPSLTLPSLRRTEEKQSPKPVPKPEAIPATKPAPKPESKPATKPAPKPVPVPATQPKPSPKPKPAPNNSSPSLGDRLRNVPLPNLNPDQLKDVPLPKKSDLNQ
jgi:outer membrane biosynthesis protein TonB